MKFQSWKLKMAWIVVAMAGLVATAAGRDTLYISVPGANAVDTISPAGVVATWVNTGLNFPTALAFDSSGNLFVANTGNNSISKITPGGTVSTFVSSGLNYPIGLAFDSSGNLYVANELGNSITKITPAGSESTFDTADLSQPVGLAFDRQGNLFVGNHSSGTPLTEISPGGVASQPLASWTWQVLAFDHAGNLFAANNGSSGLDEVQFHPNPQESSFANLPGTISQMNLDSSGNLDVLTATGGLYQVSPTGTVSPGVNITYNAGGVADPSVSLPVPEPSAACLALACGGLYLLSRSRRL